MEVRQTVVMFKIIKIILLCILIPSAVIADDEHIVLYLDPVPKIPKLVSNAMIPIANHWRLPRYIHKEFMKYCSENRYPFFISGNFDNDTLPDYAFWAILASNIRGDNRISKNLYVVTSQTGKAVLLEKNFGMGFSFDPLYTSKKGKKVYDHETDKYFNLTHDSIGARICEKSSREYVMEKDGAFKGLWTGD